MVPRKTLRDGVTEQSPVRKSNAEIREDHSGQLLGIIKDLAIEVRPKLRRGLRIELDSDLDADIGLVPDVVTDRGIHVTATDEVTIIAISRAQETADSMLGLPKISHRKSHAGRKAKAALEKEAATEAVAGAEAEAPESEEKES